MKQNEYLIPGIAAIVLAVIFPIYWMQQIISGSLDFSSGYDLSMSGLGFAKWVFLIIGLMSIYIYHSFRKVLHDRLNFKKIDIPLWLMIATSLVFFVGHFILDVFNFVNSDGVEANSQWSVYLGYAISFGGMIIFAIIDIIIAAVLLSHFEKLPSLLKALAILSLIQGIFGLTIILGAAIIITFPIYLIILAIYFLKKPEMVELV